MQSAAKPQRDSRDAAIAYRTADFEALAAGVKAELQEDGFSAAIGKFREAVNLSRGLADLEETAVRLGIETATELIPRGSRMAEAVLLEAAEVDSKQLIPRDLWKRIQERERDETIRSVLIAADGATTKAMIPPVRQRLSMLADRYPDEASLQKRLKALDAMAALQTKGERLAEKEKQIQAKEASQLQARAAWARAREFQKGGFADEALEQLQMVRALDPAFPGLDKEIQRCSANPPLPERVSPVREREQGVLPIRPQRLAPVNWDRVRSAATVALTALSLTTAAGVIWMNRAKFTSRPQAAVRRIAPAKPAVGTPFVQPVVAVRTISADDLAWSAVNPKDMDLVEGYLERFPNGANRGSAVRALSEIRIQRRESAEVRDVLRQYEAAWNARNIDGILSLRRDLDRSALQERLLPLKSTVMNLSPLSTPLIEGEQATVRCLRTVSEVNEDGVAKRSPKEAVTFVLARRDGGWIIQNASQQ